MTKSIKIILLFVIASTIANGSVSQQINKIETKQEEAVKVELIGQGRPILFLPGFTVPGSIWKETIKNLDVEAKSHLFSYAGFNGNKAIEMPWYDSIKKAIIKYVTDNNMSDIIIIGHSMGGNLAVDIASELPDKVFKIIIVEALPCIREVIMPNMPAESLYYDSPYNNQLLEMDDEQFKNMAVMMASNMTFSIDKFDIITNWILESDRKTWVYGYTELLKLDLRNCLTKLKCETLIIGASFPEIKTAQENYEKQYSNLIDKTIIMSTNSKHFVMFDQKEGFYKTVNDFIADEKK